jgi:hypothetical protein
MARKPIPAHPTRDRSRDDESLLLRSAESLGRMIAALKRQLDLATGQLASGMPNGSSRKRAAAGARVKAKRGASSTRGGARNKSPRKGTKNR